MYLLLAQTNTTGILPSKPVNLTALAIKTLVVLVITAVLIYFGIKLLSKLSSGTSKGGNIVKVLVDFPVKPGKSIVVIEILGKVFVLAVSDSDIHPVAWLEDDEWVDALTMAAEEEKPARGFADHLREMFGFKGKSKAPNKSSSAIDFLREKLKNLRKGK